MMTPDDIDVWVGLDVGKSAHHAHALDHDGNTLYDKPLKQDEKAIRTMLGKLSKHGRVLLVVDQPNTIGSLPLTVARNMGIAVAYLPGTAMRRTAQLLPGDTKTDRRDAHVIAWAALKLPETLRDAGPDDETLAALKLLAGHDEDLAHESTRHVNRLRSLLLQTHPAFERALKGERITRDATLALLERYGGPMGVKRAGIEDVKDWAKSNGLRAGRIIDDMFKAIGEQTVTVPGTLMAETIIPSIAHDIKTIRDRRREVGRQVEKLLEDHPLLTVLTSMPGIASGPQATSCSASAATSPTSNRPPTWPPTRAYRPSPANPAPASKANGPPGGATNASRTRCGRPRSSHPPNTRPPWPITSANANRANTTTPPSSASRVGAAT